MTQLTTVEYDYIQSFIPLYETRGTRIVSDVYNRLFAANPEIKSYFVNLGLFTTSLPKFWTLLILDVLSKFPQWQNHALESRLFDELVIKHVSVGFPSEYYELIEPYAYGALASAHHTTVDEHIFHTVFTKLTSLLKEKEEQLCSTLPWKGFERFQVTGIVQECKSIKSVYFTPVKTKFKLPEVKPGQHILLKVNLEGEDLVRDYNLSANTLDNKWRISVRNYNGKVSSYIHGSLKVGDILDIAAPTGIDVYDDKFKAAARSEKLALFAGGLGIFPCVPLIETALKEKKHVTLFYSSHSYHHRPFFDWLKDLKRVYHWNFKIREYFTVKPTDFSTDSLSNGVGELDDHPIRNLDMEYLTSEWDCLIVGPPHYAAFIDQELRKLKVENITTWKLGSVIIDAAPDPNV
ncbi:uncharacterized protein KQ657_002263 [Scheffersomyces spartinae]|uniref:FAD-binding FR-type domain-containing protein n=1 Tax=Scheffersomyces spartinae TaxID=45513 RepID=A0A9P7VEB9_9ASCO|nr:uncharacterized protein KQ657_002263 [Scheffersomyces spartinae]KAG7195878.1 hypothetical protein KQ657_002263 [Scheffersomyces spartinae]